MNISLAIKANYASQIYVSLVGVVTVPLLLKYLGADAYALVGFFSMIQVWFNLLDVGITPTISRQAACYRGGSLDAWTFRRLLLIIELAFISIGFVGGVVLFLISNLVTENWIGQRNGNDSYIDGCLLLVSILIATRWICGYYRAIVTGFEKITLLSLFNSIVATLRFVVVIPFLALYDSTITFFFGYQLVVALIELGCLISFSYKLIPSALIPKPTEYTPINLRDIIKFSFSIAITSSAWIVVTQTDKLVLSRVLKMADYGYFSVAVLFASGIMILGTPISNILIPKMSRLYAAGLFEDMIGEYRKSTRLVSMIAIPAACFFVLYADQILWVISGDTDLVVNVSTTMRLYAIGYTFLIVGAFPYYLQFAIGRLKMHVIGSFIFLAILIPLTIYLAENYAGVGAGCAWAIVNALYFFIWSYIIHNEYAKGIHKSWLLEDVIFQAATPLLITSIVYITFKLANDRIILGVELIGLFLLIAFSAMFFQKKLFVNG